jgi:hypothetical protein
MNKLIAFAVAAAAIAVNAATMTPDTGVANDYGQKPVPATHVAFAPRTAETGYGYEDGMTVIGLTILGWAAPNSSFDVNGVRFNFGWGAYRDTTGLDTGLFSASATATGLSATFFGNHVAGDACGWQNGLVNVVGGTMCGLQIGLVNWAERLEGVQIGLLNFARSQHFFPIVNAAW